MRDEINEAYEKMLEISVLNENVKEIRAILKTMDSYEANELKKYYYGVADHLDGLEKTLKKLSKKYPIFKNQGISTKIALDNFNKLILQKAGL